MTSKTRAPPFWRVLERWREKYGRMPRRRSGLAASSDRKSEDALAKRVERWSREGALPHALAIQLNTWVEAERCGVLLAQVTAFRASCGRMPRRKHCGDDEDNLARRLKRYCESAGLDAGDDSAHDQDPIADCGRLPAWSRMCTALVSVPVSVACSTSSLRTCGRPGLLVNGASS